ncbi:peptidoglycan D,D-transpeptidase FtsI family protein [Ruminococcus sp.]|uniref:peptidoglycan D,D-transpeptidase FtsI family protein n=1 Tax=Ruminococcus sp. TaxID=41978 RepID=UPI003995ACAF
MKRSASSYIKLSLASALVLVSCCLCSWRLMKIQVVESETYSQTKTSTQTYSQTIQATRGEIVDSSGKPIIENKVGYSLIIEPDTFPEDNTEGNQVLLSLTKILDENQVTYTTSLPISETQPYAFTEDEDAVAKLKKTLNMNVYATAENCMDQIQKEYEIDDNYTPEQQRLLAGIRYEMQLRGFSLSNRFTLAEDVPLDTVTEIKERGVTLPGVDIVEEAIRSVAQGDVVPHEIGTVGPIYAEEYDELKSKGYDLDDVVGKSGIEKAMESTLRGTDGIKEITVENGVVVSSDMKTPVEAGKTVQLTVNSDYQRELQNILDGFINNFDSLRDSKTEQLGLKKISCGAIVVLDAKTAGVLGMVTAPTYNLEDYKVDYEAILNAENTPLVNRATDGLYRPGSTFKTITATAGLNEQIITGNSTYFCGHTYHFKDHDYNCTGSHGDIAVTQALRVSCNIFFYKLSEELTIDRISEYATKFGLGQSTGLETGDAAGHLSNQETFAELGADWTVGQVLQSAIGQGEWAVTPLQMANVACTIANNGTRYEPHLVDSIWDYSHTTKLEQKEPVVADQITPVNDDVFQYVENGMIAASTNNFPTRYSLSDLGFDVAVKTGTPQVSNRVQDSFFIGYAPADDPEIAFAGVIEGGEYSKYMIRSIIQAYEKTVRGEQVNIDAVGAQTTVSTDTTGTETTTSTTSTTTH